MRALLALGLIIGATALPARDASQPARGAAPAWVDWLPLPEPKQERLPEVEGGRYTLLRDSQIRHDGNNATIFVRTAVLVTDRAGLEGAAQKEIEFDPADEDLIFHRVAIWRDGRMIDVTRSVTIESLRRESELKDGIITGSRTALVRIADVRVGDIVDLATSWRERDASWRGIYAADFALGFAVPVAQSRVRLIMPASMPLSIRDQNKPPRAIVTTASGMTTREWRAVDPEPVRDEERSPTWWQPWARVSVTTMPDWGAVVRWAQSRYAGDLTLPAGYAARVDAIAARAADPAARANAALRLVQDTIRYTSISIGEGGYRPRSPAETIANGYGDCKDKAQLLVATLRRLGIAAWPALTDSDEGAALPQAAPSPGAFDHVIVLATVAGRDYWLDATGSYQGGSLAELAALSYAHALPIRAGQDRLLAIANSVPARPTMQTLDRYRRTAEGVAFTTTTLFTQDEVDIKRRAIADSGLAKLERDELAFYRSLYPGLVRRSRAQVADDRAANRLLVHQRYLLPVGAAAFRKTLGEFEVQAVTLRDLYKTVPADRGAAPITVPYTIHRTHRIVLDTPGFRPPRPSASVSEGPGFKLTMTSERDGDRLVLGYTLVGEGPTIAGTDAAAYVEQVEKLDNDTWWALDLTSSDGGLIDGGARDIAVGALAVLVALGWLVVLGFALARVIREKHDVDAPFVPMPPWRFALLTVATFGLYASYWTWRHWRWTKEAEGADVWPFGRGLFSLLWAGPTFFSANARATPALPAWVGYATAVLLPVGVIGLRIGETVTGAVWLTLLAVLLELLLLPALIAVNRANTPERVASRARLGPLAIAGVAAGWLTWTVVTAVTMLD